MDTQEITVRFDRGDRGQRYDLFQEVGTENFYMRRPINKGMVRWLIAGRGVHGFVPARPVEAGATMVVLTLDTSRANEAFRERPYNDEYYEHGTAVKRQHFSWEDEA